MQRVDLDRDCALNTTERDRALQTFVPDDVYDPYLLVSIARTMLLLREARRASSRVVEQ